MSAIADASNIPAELREQWRVQQGLDRPLGVQYVRWIGNVARGDFGHSTSQNQPVSTVLLDKLPNTLVLMSLALAASIGLGSLIGAWQGANAGTRRDRSVTLLSLVLYSIPEFWFALLLGFVFAYRIHILPATGMIDVAMYDSMSVGQQFIDRLRHLILPWTALTVMGTAIFARYQREAMLDTVHEPFTRTARAKGLSERTVRRQTWRLAVLPVITLGGLTLPALLTGAVFVEQVFGWPGMGSALLAAINARDYALVSACVIVGSAMTALGTLLADVLRAAVDPRLRRA
ncbi:MAG: ABC transporter permease [Gemmatimonadaceae bacterium]|nr:ABC transporter permease [Gemmatimonadaceae bacterium]